MLTRQELSLHTRHLNGQAQEHGALALGGLFLLPLAKKSGAHRVFLHASIVVVPVFNFIRQSFVFQFGIAFRIHVGAEK